MLDLLFHLTSVDGGVLLQMNISMLVSGLHVSLSLQPNLEEAMRIVPRSAFLPPSQAAEAWLSKAVMAAGGPPIVLGPPAAEMLALQVGSCCQSTRLVIDIGYCRTMPLDFGAQHVSSCHARFQHVTV